MASGTPQQDRRQCHHGGIPLRQLRLLGLGVVSRVELCSAVIRLTVNVRPS